MVYIGTLEVDGVNKLYISSVPADTTEDYIFEDNSMYVECSRNGKKDHTVAKNEMNVLRNILTRAGVGHGQITLE